MVHGPSDPVAEELENAHETDRDQGSDEGVLHEPCALLPTVESPQELSHGRPF